MKTTVDDLLTMLHLQQSPVSISSIMQTLTGDVSERTVRRWLQKLVEQGVVARLGSFKASVYSLSNPRYFFSKKALASLAKAKLPLHQRDPCTYDESWLNAYQPNVTYYLTQQQREKLAETSAQFLGEVPAGTYTEKIFNRLLVDLSYNSSRLEGNTYTLLETEKLVLKGKASVNKLNAEKLMILNHKEAIKFLINGINRIEISPDNVRTIHYLLADSLVSASDAGQIRKEVVRVSGTTYAPLENSATLENILELICNKARDIDDPFEQSFFLLVHLAYLQCFIDVNKRTARIAANIPLVRNNLIPVSFKYIAKEDYISSVIATYEFHDVTPLAELYVWSYLHSCKDYNDTTTAMGIDVFRARYREQRRQVMAEIINQLVLGAEIKAHVMKFASLEIDAEDRERFVNDVLKELAHLESFKLVGMGVSSQQFKTWQIRLKSGSIE
jgi:Fic family protein